MAELERRAMELRVSKEGKLEGLAIPYNSRSLDLGGFTEVILPGAATDSIKGDVLALYAHDTSRLLGRTISGTLTLSEDNRGVSYSIDLPNTQDGNDVRELVRRGDLRGASFGFNVIADDWSNEGGKTLRTISKLQLGEITITACPAYPATTAAVRSLEQWSQGRRRREMKIRLLEL